MREMRALGLLGILTTLVAALSFGCATENAVGPGKVTITQSTSTIIPTTIAPVTAATFIFAPTAPAALQLVSFNAFGSTVAPGRTIVSYSWDFRDGVKKPD